MKGPYERLKYDLRRLWECPACKRRERTSGAVTFRHCTCVSKQEGKLPPVMRLIADGPQRLVPPILAATGQGSESATVLESATGSERATVAAEFVDTTDASTSGQSDRPEDRAAEAPLPE